MPIGETQSNNPRICQRTIPFLESARFEKILCHWSINDHVESAIALTQELIKFQPDPQSKEKQARRQVDPHDLTTFLEPRPRFNEWEYEQILEKGAPFCFGKGAIPNRSNTDLYRVRDMIFLQFHRDELEEAGSNDHSPATIWCKRVNGPSGKYRESNENLVHTLTFVCEQVYEKSPKFVEALDQALRNQRWDVRSCASLPAPNFGGLSHPNEQTKSWIRELILAYKDFGKWEYEFEFQRMIRVACEKFGANLLKTTEMTPIFEAILNGPSEQASSRVDGR